MTPYPLTAPPEAVLFDCDGVLVDSEPLLLALLQKDFAAYGLHLDMPEIERDYVGGTIHTVAERARAAGAPLPDGWGEDFYERIYEILAEGTPLVPGIEAVFDALDAAGVRYAVGSNGTDRKMEITLGQHPGLYRRLEGRMFSGQALGKPKPAPDLYLHAAGAVAADPARCVVIEDSATGARAARNAGIPCFGYAAHGDGARLTAEGAQVFHAMADLPALLRL
ncbi:HAD family hydrolase [Acidimangrovimonas sediminis]|uniref:HAD family hydrolase n=1 Tax=Acidimangrovimonas sediminis TaxID=2056283 RepID=UPI000C803EEC|nr:HAD-IA family hydrolase [Acidimangrovimonas sediminis]